MRNNGTFNFGANLEVKKDAPLDSRTLVTNYADLIKKETWKDSDGNTWTYVGMLVTCQDKPGKLYQLIKKDYTQVANWKEIGVSAKELANYLPLTGGDLSGSLSVGSASAGSGENFTEMDSDNFAVGESGAENEYWRYGYGNIKFDGEYDTFDLTLPKANGTLVVSGDVVNKIDANATEDGSSVEITLQSNNNDNVSTTTIEAATTESAGVMTATDKQKTELMSVSNIGTEENPQNVLNLTNVGDFTATNSQFTFNIDLDGLNFAMPYEEGEGDEKTTHYRYAMLKPDADAEDDVNVVLPSASGTLALKTEVDAAISAAVATLSKDDINDICK